MSAVTILGGFLLFAMYHGNAHKCVDEPKFLPNPLSYVLTLSLLLPVPFFFASSTASSLSHYNFQCTHLRPHSCAVSRNTGLVNRSIQSESYCLQLQQCGLTASIAPDNKFEGDGDGEGEE